jgi:hypothetical protein
VVPEDNAVTGDDQWHPSSGSARLQIDTQLHRHRSCLARGHHLADDSWIAHGGGERGSPDKPRLLQGAPYQRGHVILHHQLLRAGDCLL